MSRRRIFATVVAMLSLAAGARAEDAWVKIKAGMSRGEMTAALGEPLMKTSGREFELCVFDAGAEVVCFRGTVVAWTAPAGSAAVDGRQLDLRGVPQPRLARAQTATKVYVPRGERDDGFQRISPRRTRMPRL